MDVILQITTEELLTTLVKIQEQLFFRLPGKPPILTATIAHHQELNLISIKIAGKDAHVLFEQQKPDMRMQLG